MLSHLARIEQPLVAHDVILVGNPGPDFSHKKRIRATNQRKLLCDNDFCLIRGTAPMLTECNPDLFGFVPVGRREVVGSFDGGSITSDAGAPLLKQTTGPLD
jgi:hypothetical protein